MTATASGAVVTLKSLNPVRAKFLPRAQDWKWSSVKAHLAGVDDEPATARPVLDRIANFANLLRDDIEEDFAEVRRSEAGGRPVGAPDFDVRLERLPGSNIALRAPGCKPNKSPTSKQLDLL